MLNGLTREVRWRDVTDETPQKAERVIVALWTPEANGDPIHGRVPSVRAAYWNGREFQTAEAPFYPLHTVTHWMPYPALPSEDAMRRVFRELLAPDEEESTC